MSLVEQGIWELMLLSVGDAIHLQESSHPGHWLDLLMEVLSYWLVFQLCETHLRMKDRKYTRLSQDYEIRKEQGRNRALNILAMVITAVASLVHDNSFHHVAVNIIQTILSCLIIYQYKYLLSLCEAILLSKVLTQLLALTYPLVSHFGETSELIIQVADLFLISSVAIPLVSLLMFKYVKKSIVIPMILIGIQVILACQIVDFDVPQLVLLTLQDNYAFFAFGFFAAVTILGIFLAMYLRKQTTQKIFIRKVFHFQIVLILIVGVCYAPILTMMASAGIFWIFCLVELLRQSFSTEIKAINRLDQFVTQFIDEKDCKQLIITHIYLLLGVAYPFITSYHIQDRSVFFERSLSGVLVLGVGDSFAAIIGKLLGKRKIFNSDKSLEGLMAFIGSVIAVTKIFNLIVPKTYAEEIIMDDWFYFKICLVGFIEATTKQVDNLLLPVLFLAL